MTTLSHIGIYCTVVGFATIEFSKLKSNSDGGIIHLNVLLEHNGDPIPITFDLEQETLPIAVSRHLPPKYVLETSCEFKTPVDVIIFIQYSTKSHVCFLSTAYLQYTLQYTLPMNILSAALVKCSVLIAHRLSTSASAIKGGYYLSKIAKRSKRLMFKSFLTQKDIYTLYYQSVIFGLQIGRRNMRQIRFFYRNKSEEYFDTIFRYCNGDMCPYLKNQGGEQGSVLNGRLKGLFFSTMVDLWTNEPRPSSYYGPIRFYFNASIMLNEDSCLYFSDFYCHNIKHHVTLILTHKLSPCNNLCREYLTQLNLYQNPYLRILDDNRIVANMDFVVEVFYTEIVNLLIAMKAKQGFMMRTSTIGRGYAPPSGIPKRPSCEHCNIINS